MRILGLDFGEKRIGVAVSDPLGITAQGLTVISYERPDEALEMTARLCREYAAEEIVVGLPLNMDGSRGAAARAAGEFAARLADLVPIPVRVVDERLTSRAAERALLEGGVRRGTRRKVRDKVAAALILESYLAGRKKGD